MLALGLRRRQYPPIRRLSAVVKSQSLIRQRQPAAMEWPVLSTCTSLRLPLETGHAGSRRKTKNKKQKKTKQKRKIVNSVLVLLVVANLSANGDLNVLLISSRVLVCVVLGSLRIIASSYSSLLILRFFFLLCCLARLLLGFII